MVGGSSVPRPHQPLGFLVPISQVITTAASLHLGHFIHHHFISPHLHLDLLLQFSLKSISDLGDVPRLKDVLHKSFVSFKGINFFHWPENAILAASSSYIRSFSGEGSKNKPGNVRRRSDLHSRRGLFIGRDWTNILLGVNVLVYIAQIASQGKLILWGAKVNSLINEGQLWRLATSSFLHATIGHLMVNCYSLNSIGPTVENICGPRRYLAVYMSSAIASSAMSYWLCKAPAVGASGAIFGLVGSFAVFILRHRGLIGGGTEDLQHIARVIVLNMGIGLLSQGIDNWGHLLRNLLMLIIRWMYSQLQGDGSWTSSDSSLWF